MKIKVTQQPSNTIVVNQQATNQVVSVGVQGPSGPNVVTGADDVDASVLVDGSVLVYKTNTQKWTSTTTLDAQNMEGGEF